MICFLTHLMLDVEEHTAAQKTTHQKVANKKIMMWSGTTVTLMHIRACLVQEESVPFGQRGDMVNLKSEQYDTGVHFELCFRQTELILKLIFNRNSRVCVCVSKSWSRQLMQIAESAGCSTAHLISAWSSWQCSSAAVVEDFHATIACASCTRAIKLEKACEESPKALTKSDFTGD